MSTTEIPLTQGKVAIVDDVDADVVGLGWYAVRGCRTWYARRPLPAVNGRRWGPSERLHRAIWARAHPDEPAPRRLDHKNGNGLDCRRFNLRPANGRQNARNARLRHDNVSGLKGIHTNKAYRGRWRAQIRADGELIHLGMFATPKEAAAAYDAAARTLFGAFACVNFALPGERSAT
jgi:hypothetical protein